MSSRRKWFLEDPGFRRTQDPRRSRDRDGGHTIKHVQMLVDGVG